MKKAITTFLLVGFILSFVIIGLGALLIILGAVHNPVEGENIGRGIYFVLAGTANLIGMIIIRKKWPEVKAKSEVKKIAVWSIVLGALITVFPIPAGILMLVMPADQYGKEE